MSKTIRQIIHLANDRLFAADVANSTELDVELLLAFVVGKSRSYLYAWADSYLPDDIEEQFLALLEQRLNGKPVAYILGEQEFWSMPLTVTQDTLIPRPETEHIIDYVLEEHCFETLNVIDAGTGSGAIALALKKENPDWLITAIDNSEKALAVAKKNAKKLGLDVQFQHGNWLEGIKKNSVDVIVSNPPYIAEGDKHLKDLHYEPLTALVAADDGLQDIKTIVNQAKDVLFDQGTLYIEHGYDQGEAVQQIFNDHGFVKVKCEKDYSGNDRFTHGMIIKQL